MAKKLLKGLAGVGALLLVSLAMTAPALAGGKDKGPKSAYTEDNDSNDNGTMNNVSDDGDNKHPSGKDRSIEHGKSGNQGKSGSDPDGDSNGGADKPNGSGGNDKADQDGNNGCGNDDDFEDDNNGNCGPKDKKDKKDKSAKDCRSRGNSHGKGKSTGKGKSHKKDCAEGSSTPTDEDVVEDATSTEPCDDEMVAADSEDCNHDDGDDEEVLGSHVGGGPGTEGDDVLGDDVANDGAEVAAGREAGSTLPFTGASILSIVALGIGLLGAGALLMRNRRNAQI